MSALFKKLLASFTLILTLTPLWGAEYYFVSKEDEKDIMLSSKTEWGRDIVARLQSVVEQRQAHSLSVPLLEGGHLHHYFCPIHNLSFEFDWNSPNAHYCNSCKKHWHDNRYSWAWINKVHEANLCYLEACTYLYYSTGERRYAEYIRDMLLDYADKYPTYFEHNVNRLPTALNSGKLFGQSLDESVWASDAARAYMAAKNIMTPQEVSKIESGYLRPCAELLMKRKGGGNWQVWHNSGLIALGVALGDDTIIDEALNDPKCGYHRMMKEHVHDDGWWNEGSPVYHYYPLRAMLLSAEALRCRNINLYDDKLRNMLSSPVLGIYCDLSLPAHNDGWYGESLITQVKLYEIAYKRYGGDLFRNILEKCYAKTERNSAEALLNPQEINTGRANTETQGVCFKDLGVAVLRSGDRTLVLKYGPHGGGHGHPDKLSISLHDGCNEVLSDMGTSAYGVPDYEQWYRKTLSHSTVVVDAKSQTPCTGQLIEYKATRKGGVVEATTSQAYAGIVMSRRLMLNGDKLTDMFVCDSPEEHQYDYVLILTQKPEFTTASVASELKDASEYRKIGDVRKRNFDSAFEFNVGQHKINIDFIGSNSVEVFTGVAVGIPPTNPSVDTPQQTERSAAQQCYPLILRIKGDKVKIKAMWKL